MSKYIREKQSFFSKAVYDRPYNMHFFHYHDEHEIYYLESGRTKYFIEDELYFLNPGEMIFVPRRVFHKTNSEDNTVAKRILLCFDDEFIDEEYKKYIEEFTKNKNITIGSKHHNKITEILTKIENEEIKKEKDYEAMQKLYFNQLLVLISRYRSHKNEVEFSRSYSFIQDIAKYISANVESDLSLEALACHFAITPNHLSKQFKKITGVGLNDFINISRITSAERLLVSTNMSITEIALACGFNDSNYFASVFKKFKGITPKKYSLINK